MGKGTLAIGHGFPDRFRLPADQIVVTFGGDAQIDFRLVEAAIAVHLGHDPAPLEQGNHFLKPHS